MEDGNDNEILSQNIEYTDLTQNLKFYFSYDGKYWTMLLPSEY